MPTVTTTEQHAVMVATLVETRNGERAGQAPRARDISGAWRKLEPVEDDRLPADVRAKREADRLVGGDDE